MPAVARPTVHRAAMHLLHGGVLHLGVPPAFVRLQHLFPGHHLPLQIIRRSARVARQLPRGCRPPDVGPVPATTTMLYLRVPVAGTAVPDVLHSPRFAVGRGHHLFFLRANSRARKRCVRTAAAADFGGYLALRWLPCAENPAVQPAHLRHLLVLVQRVQHVLIGHLRGQHWHHWSNLLLPERSYRRTGAERSLPTKWRSVPEQLAAVPGAPLLPSIRMPSWRVRLVLDHLRRRCPRCTGHLHPDLRRRSDAGLRQRLWRLGMHRPAAAVLRLPDGLVPPRRFRSRACSRACSERPPLCPWRQQHAWLPRLQRSMQVW